MSGETQVRRPLDEHPHGVGERPSGLPSSSPARRRGSRAGGSTEVESRPGEGTLVILRLPGWTGEPSATCMEASRLTGSVVTSCRPHSVHSEEETGS